MNTQYVLHLNDKTIATDEDGFLLDPEEWEPELAELIARGQGLELDDAHWEVISFVRGYFEEHRSVPEARKVLKHLAGRLGKERATRKYLYQLFPFGYGQQACKIAGMRKPMKLWLDL
jgi:tRNA 2-thiouridine synthesizing protein E